jgi:uncharacterized membrane protein YedE/YeeE
MQIFKQKAWSPYVAGIVIGLLQIPAFLLIQSPLGCSSSYVTAAGFTCSIVDAGIHENAYFEKHMVSKKNFWQVSMMIGIAVGAWISRRCSKAVRQPFSPIWTKALGLKTLSSRMAVGFIGGFIMLLGARWADGCTSGHGLSGIGQLAISSILFTAVFFAAGIGTAMLFRRV